MAKNHMVLQTAGLFALQYRIFKHISFLLIIFLGLFLASCDKNEGGLNDDSFNNRSTVAADYPQSSLPVQTVSSNITSSTTWTNDRVWEISGVVYVTGGTLTIQPGTFIKSTVNTAGQPNGVLVITRNASINAVGNASNPIVFTSRYLLDGNSATVGTPGDFGGVIILGESTVNTSSGTSNIEGLPVSANTQFGGTTPADNSGSFRYVRIEYAGYQLTTNVEVNGLTLGGVGSGTTINNVQVSYGLDDGFEFFGGKVSASNLIAFGNDDDQFDYDLGYVGTLSNSWAIADVNSSHSTSGGVSDSNGAEIDNTPDEDEYCSTTTTTEVTFDNVRIIGTRTLATVGGQNAYENGVHVRRGATLFFNNSITTGYPVGLRVESNGGCELGVYSGSSLHGFTSAQVGGTNDGGNTTSTASTAPNFGIPQPFFNQSGFNLGVTYSWAKFTF